MSNRIGGLLILGIAFGVGYLFYWYYFVYSLVNITFVTNVDNFTISMESTQKNHNFQCDSNTCVYDKISPFEYQVTLTSDTFKDINFAWKPSKTTAIKNIDFQKNFQLEKSNLLSQDDVTKILNETIDSQKEETIAEKIQKLKEKSQIHLVIKINNNRYVFKKNSSDMSLYKDDVFLGNFEYTNKSEISLKEVLGNINYLSIVLNKKKYLFSMQTGIIHKYILDIPIKYIKSTDVNGKFIFVTDKGSFIYDLYKNEFNYNTYFSDFVFFNNTSLVGVIHKNEFNKRSRFEYDNITDKTLVIQYTPNSKEKNILLETEKEIIKIFKLDGKIYFEDQDKMNFILTHLEE